MKLNVPDSNNPRVIIVGAGFAGLRLARRLANHAFQVVLIDKHNFHQFQPLYYQVAMSGLEPSSISFPLRKVFQRQKNVFIRICSLEHIDVKQQTIHTSEGDLDYDKLIIAMGAVTNFYGNEVIKQHAYTLKTVSDALDLRNRILEDYEAALLEEDYMKRQGLIDYIE